MEDLTSIAPGLCLLDCTPAQQSVDFTKVLVDFTKNSVMQGQAVPMFYDSESCMTIPSLYICNVKNIPGRVPMPVTTCFVGDNMQPTIPYRFRTQRRRAGWAADTRPDAGNSSLYQLNLWMWRRQWRYDRGHWGRSARSRFWTPWRREQRRFARLVRGTARRSSAGG